ncbi:TrbI/VirB10 family protein [Anthocerotibacter panamensis]|uniref:TrbI/VirB10 family protein n=1 Tax=Anthocerotibacter panamensis TaxID=2857077 RepID=UPI001C402113|nr:TrbI/VirB10 family protein [Anthocerotibacter panamensis]
MNSNGQQKNPNRRAALVGFKEQPSEAASDSSVPISLPEVGSKPLWSNPFAKIAVVGSATLTVALILGTFLSKGLPGSEKAAVKQTTPAAVRTPTLAETEALPSDPERGKLLTELALTRQMQELETFNATKPTATKPAPAPLPPPAPAPALAPTPLPQVRAPLPPPVLNIPQSGPAQNPTAQWLALGQVGSYGQISQDGPATTTSNPRSIKGGVQTNQVPVPDFQEETPVLNGRVSRSVTVGSRAQGLLLDPVAWEGNKPDVADERYLVQLLTPLIASDGSEAISGGTQLVTMLEKTSATGVLRLSALAILNEGREQPLPKGAITVRATGGLPLTAKNLRDRGPEIASLDTGLFALAGAAKAAELFNRPESTTTIAGIGGLSTATTNPPPNIVAGVIQGGAEILTRQIEQRNQLAIREALNRPNLWVLEAGIKVEIFVNQSTLL